MSNSARNQPTLQISLQQLRSAGLLDELANTIDDESVAHGVLETLGFPQGRMPPFQGNTSLEFWREGSRQIERGIIPNITLADLLDEATNIYPGNHRFSNWRELLGIITQDTQEESTQNKDEENKVKHQDSDKGVSIIIVGHNNEALQLFEQTQELALQSSIPEPIELSFTTGNALAIHLVNATAQQALQLRQLLTEQFPMLAIDVGQTGFNDYLIRRLFLEGPDQQRFQLDNVPASTSVSDVTQATMSQYQDEMWPHDAEGIARPAVADRIKEDGSSERLEPDSNLDDNNIAEEETIQISPESTAGSVNPLIREEALVRVRLQITDFARTHKGFKVSANAQHAPTEYIIEFSAASWAPSKQLNGTPVSIDKHKILIALLSDFPMKAPVVSWQNPIFHPNIHPENGFVCLGELQLGYRPSMDFGKLCQLLIDIASFRNYEAREGEYLYKEAGEWAQTPEGQQAIISLGGKLLKSSQVVNSNNKFHYLSIVKV